MRVVPLAAALPESEISCVVDVTQTQQPDNIRKYIQPQDDYYSNGYLPIQVEEAGGLTIDYDSDDNLGGIGDGLQ